MPPALIDTHCHLNFPSFDDDRAAVLERAEAAGVSGIIVPAVDLRSCQQALQLAETHSGLHAAIGIHPNSSAEYDRASIGALRDMASHRRIVAIGEIGLDYYRESGPKVAQQAALEKQLELAAELELPVIIHNREAAADLMAILENWAPTVPESLKQRLGVLHSFSATYDIAERALELGFYIGFTGPITFKNADGLREIAKRVPLDRLLIETDSPFLAPQQRRGKRNEPAYLRYICEKLAALRGVDPAQMARVTTSNAVALFALG